MQHRRSARPPQMPPAPSRPPILPAYHPPATNPEAVPIREREPDNDVPLPHTSRNLLQSGRNRNEPPPVPAPGNSAHCPLRRCCFVMTMPQSTPRVGAEGGAIREGNGYGPAPRYRREGPDSRVRQE